MLANIMMYEKSTEIRIGEHRFEKVTLQQPVGRLPAGSHFDCATLNLHTGKFQLCNYDQNRNTPYGRPMKQHYDFAMKVSFE